MEIVTVGPKYQVVIPKKIRKQIKIHPGDKVGLILEDSGKVNLEIKPKNWVERTRGMMSEAWKGVDTTKELNKIRDEWEERLKEIEKTK